MKALVTGAGALLGQGIITSLLRSAIDVEVIAVDPNHLSAGLYWAKRGYTVPLAASPQYLDRVRVILASERPEIVFVGTDAELPVFAGARLELEREFGTHIVVSDPNVVAIADDKYLTYEFMRNSGFHPPATALPGDEDRLVEGVGFPLVVKPRRGARSVGVRVVRTAAELGQALENGTDTVIQEHIGSPDTEFTAGVLCFEGQEIVSVVMRRDLRDGNTYRAYTGAFTELNEHVIAFARALRPYGPANFQFRLDTDGRPRVFEINARFSGTTPLRALAGFHEVEMCLCHLLQGRRLIQPAVQEIAILRYWSELVVTPSEIASIR